MDLRRVRTLDSQAQVCERLALAWYKVAEPRLGQVVKPGIRVEWPTRSLSAQTEAKPVP